MCLLIEKFSEVRNVKKYFYWKPLVWMLCKLLWLGMQNGCSLYWSWLFLSLGINPLICVSFGVCVSLITSVSKLKSVWKYLLPLPGSQHRHFVTDVMVTNLSEINEPVKTRNFRNTKIHYIDVIHVQKTLCLQLNLKCRSALVQDVWLSLFKESKWIKTHVKYI